MAEGVRLSVQSNARPVSVQVAPLQFVSGASLAPTSGVDKLAAGTLAGVEGVMSGIKVGVSGVTQGIQQGRKNAFANKKLDLDKSIALEKMRSDQEYRQDRIDLMRQNTDLRREKVEGTGIPTSRPTLPWETDSAALSGVQSPEAQSTSSTAVAAANPPTSLASVNEDPQSIMAPPLPEPGSLEELQSSLFNVKSPVTSSSVASSGAPAATTQPVAPQKGAWSDIGGGVHAFTFPSGKVLYAQADPSKKDGFSWIPGAGEDPDAKVTAQAAKKDAADSRDQKTAELHNRAIRQEQSAFQNTPAVKILEGQNGPRQALPRFLADYDKVVSGKKGAGISDMGLIDMFIRAESGGRVTEAQFAEAKKSKSWIETINWRAGTRPTGGDILTQEQRDQMHAVIIENYNMGARLANQAVGAIRDRMIDQGVTNEKQLPQPYVLIETKESVNDEITRLGEEAIGLEAQSKALITQGKTAEAKIMTDKIKELMTQGQKLRKLKEKNAKKTVYNMNDFLDKRQGFGSGGAAVTINQD